MPPREEFAKVYLDYSDRIFRYMFLHTKNFQLAEDLTSEVFLRAWQAWSRFDGQNLQAWLYRIAHNLLVDTYRKKKEVPLDSVGEVSIDEDLVGKIATDGQIRQLTQALDQLPANLNRVVILRFIEGLSVAQVTAILGISEVNVRVLSHRALVKIRKVMANEKN